MWLLLPFLYERFWKCHAAVANKFPLDSIISLLLNIINNLCEGYSIRPQVINNLSLLKSATFIEPPEKKWLHRVQGQYQLYVFALRVSQIRLFFNIYDATKLRNHVPNNMDEFGIDLTFFFLAFDLMEVLISYSIKYDFPSPVSQASHSNVVLS